MTNAQIIWLLFAVSTFMILLGNLSAELVHYDNQVYHIQPSDENDREDIQKSLRKYILIIKE